MCSESSHQVKTMAKAAEWFPRVVTSQLPITVDSSTGAGGRVCVRIYSASGKLIERRG